MSKDDDGLNPRQRKFVHCYVVRGMAAGRAYEAAGYTSTGHASDASASKLLTNPDIQAAVRAAKRELSEVNRWEKWQLLDLLQEVLETPVNKVGEDSRLVQEIVRDEVAGPGGDEDEAAVATRVRVKLFPKKDAAKMMADMMGWNAPEKKEDTGVVELAKVLANMRNTPAKRA